MDKTMIINEIKKEKKFSTDKEFADFLGVHNQNIYDWKKRNTLNYDLIVEKIPEINANWLLTGKGAIYKQDKPVIIPSEKGIPLIPIEAMAGWGQGDIQVMDYEAGCYVVPEFEEDDVDFLIRVKGSSMYPKYSSGDLIACKKINLDTFFQWNKVYALDTSQGALIKRIKKSEESGFIKCVSDNKDYDPFELPLSELYNIALVKGVIRFE